MIPEYRRGVTLAQLNDDVERDLRRRAVLSVCARATSAHDADDLLETLGLDPREGRVFARPTNSP